MEIEVRESVSLKDGTHEGNIVRVEYREEPYKYTDVYIKEKESEFELKYGVPTNSNIDSKLMTLLRKFTQIAPGQKIDPEKTLLGRKVSFMTMQEESKKDGRSYTRIVDGSIRPLDNVPDPKQQQTATQPSN
jgi:hypothetical protein